MDYSKLSNEEKIKEFLQLVEEYTKEKCDN